MAFRTRTARSFLGLAVASALVAAGCGSDETASADGEILAPSVFEGQATTITGETFDLAMLAGSDLILWFWAPW